MALNLKIGDKWSDKNGKTLEIMSGRKVGFFTDKYDVCIYSPNTEKLNKENKIFKSYSESQIRFALEILLN